MMNTKEIFYPNFLEINLNSVKKNCKTLQGLTSSSFFCPMVKSEAYGHGSIPITKALLSCGVNQVGVINTLEAQKLRDNIKSSFDILIFGPLLNESNQDLVIKNKFIPVCSHWDDLRAFAQKKTELSLHIKFNTGFSRLGFPVYEAEKIKTFLNKNSFLKLKGLCTQLIDGKNIFNPESYSFKQIQKLEELKSFFPSQVFHVFNTESLLSSFAYEIKRDLGARPGIGLYGIKGSCSDQNAFNVKKWNSISLLPTTSLKSSIVNVHKLQKGEKISYSGTWEASRPSVIVTVPLGYADMFSRRWGEKEGCVLIRGKRASVVGRVCMDFIMIDVTDLSLDDPICIKEEVIIFGRQGKEYLSIEEHAEKMGTLTHELFVHFGNRIQRSYVE